jgi:hypothetical protein
MHATSDGKYLLTRDNRIHRLRIDGDELVHEESTAETMSGYPGALCVSGDGKWLAHFNVRGLTQYGRGIGIFDVKQLKQCAFSVKEGARPTMIGFDDATGELYSPSNDRLLVFGPRGDKVREFRIGADLDYRKLEVLPGGRRFVLWAESRVSLYDLVPERLTAAAAVHPVPEGAGDDRRRREFRFEPDEPRELPKPFFPRSNVPGDRERMRREAERLRREQERLLEEKLEREMGGELKRKPELELE